MKEPGIKRTLRDFQELKEETRREGTDENPAGNSPVLSKSPVLAQVKR